MLRNVSDLDLTFQGHPRSNVTAIGLTIYGFLSMFNSNIGSKSSKWAPLRDIRLQNLDDVDFDLSRSVKDSRSNVTVPLDSPYMVSY